MKLLLDENLSARVLRGGDWNGLVVNARSADRNGNTPANAVNNRCGLRLARGPLPSGEAGSR